MPLTIAITNNYSGTNPDPELASYAPVSDVDKDIITEQAYDANGNLVKSVDAAGRVSFTVYDSLNRVVRTVRNAKDDATIDLNGGDTGYNPVNDPRSVLDSSTPGTPDDGYQPSTDPDRDHIEETTYDAMGRVVTTSRLLENRDSEIWTVTRFVYDSLGRQVLTIANFVDNNYDVPENWLWVADHWEDGTGTTIQHGSDSDQNIISETIYDSRGRVEQTRNVDGIINYMVYDVDGRQVLTVANYVDNGYALPNSWTWNESTEQWEDEDVQGANIISHGANSDENIISQTVYDGEGRVQSTRDVEGKVTFRGYDDAGRQFITVTNYVDNGYTAPDTWSWDSIGEQWQDNTSPTKQVISHGTDNDENIISYTEYDAEGRVVSTRDNLGRVTRPVYDDANRQRMSISNYVDNSYAAPENWIWVTDHWEDGSSTTISHGTNNDENRISETVFDAFGRVESTRDVSGRQTVHEYDALGRRVKTIANYVDGVF